MNKEQLNSLAIEARAGSVNAMWEVKAHFQKTIHRLSESNRNMVRSQQKFEEDMFKRIEEAVRIYKPECGNFEPLVISKLYERLRRWQKRHIGVTQGAQVLSINREIEEHDYDIKDDLAIVDAELLKNEKITGLAAGDPRKLAILNSWLDPYFNDSSTADLLAQIYGGKSESHRKFIGRFRNACQTALADAI
ncbi:hypothetical protein [Paenibacillus sp. FSL R7-0128]|uniref:hypothetical protein n=1 Tax=Paenibacillus sp. FSL R7-0128 TaxID=2954529 RepID=UPI0030F4D402